MYTCKYLKIEELVPRAMFDQYKNKQHILWYQFNPLLLETADMLREKYGAITVNNWHTGGTFQNRGLRADDTTTGVSMSAHKRGAALDCNFKNASAEQIRKDMEALGCFKPGFKDSITEENKMFQYINRVENTIDKKQISWFHFDIFNSYNADGSIIRLDL